MNNEAHFLYAQKGLDCAEEKLKACEYDNAIVLLAAAYAEVRQLMEHALCMKREALLAANPPGENTV